MVECCFWSGQALGELDASQVKTSNIPSLHFLLIFCFYIGFRHYELCAKLHHLLFVAVSSSLPSTLFRLYQGFFEVRTLSCK